MLLFLLPSPPKYQPCEGQSGPNFGRWWRKRASFKKRKRPFSSQYILLHFTSFLGRRTFSSNAKQWDTMHSQLSLPLLHLEHREDWWKCNLLDSGHSVNHVFLMQPKCNLVSTVPRSIKWTLFIAYSCFCCKRIIMRSLSSGQPRRDNFPGKKHHQILQIAFMSEGFVAELKLLCCTSMYCFL